MNKILIGFLLCIFFFSCKEGKPETEKVSQEIEEKIELGNCEYSIVTKPLSFEWVAFKTTEKIAVRGSFDKIKIRSSKVSESLSDLLENTEFKISLGSVNSGNEDRDKKIKQFVFGNMRNKKVFFGSIIECDGDLNDGVLEVKLEMNGRSEIVKMKYSTSSLSERMLQVKLTGQLDLLDWGAEKSIEALNKACQELHKGADGVSKTWSEVEINVALGIKLTCE